MILAYMERAGTHRELLLPPQDRGSNPRQPIKRKRGKGMMEMGHVSIKRIKKPGGTTTDQSYPYRPYA